VCQRLVDRPDDETLTHRLILPRDANHYGTLFAGGLLSLALEAAYSGAHPLGARFEDPFFRR
jgi:acyl-CoA hydrolase